MLCRSGQIRLISQDLHCWSHATFIPRAGLGRSGAAQGTGLDRQVLMCTSHASAVWIHLQILPWISFSILLNCYHVQLDRENLPNFYPPDPPAFCWGYWFNLSGTSTFYSPSLLHRAILGTLLAFQTFFYCSPFPPSSRPSAGVFYSSFLRCSFWLLPLLHHPTPPPLPQFSCTSVPCVLPGAAFRSCWPLIPSQDAHRICSHPSFPLPSLLRCCGWPRLAVVNFCFIL